jgi:hypothetical protein
MDYGYFNETSFACGVYPYVTSQQCGCPQTAGVLGEASSLVAQIVYSSLKRSKCGKRLIIVPLGG